MWGSVQADIQDHLQRALIILLLLDVVVITIDFLLADVQGQTSSDTSVQLQASAIARSVVLVNLRGS